jgi:hypothetical protein
LRRTRSVLFKAKDAGHARKRRIMVGKEVQVSVDIESGLVK